MESKNSKITIVLTKFEMEKLVMAFPADYV